MRRFNILYLMLTILCLVPPNSALATLPANTDNPLTHKISESSTESKTLISKKTRLRGHIKEISLFALSKDGRLGLTCDEDENNYIWDMNTGALIREIGKPEEVRIRVVTAAFSPDSSQLIWARTRKIMPVLWDVESGRRIGVLSSKEKGHIVNIVALTFSDDGRYIATGDSQGTLVVWNRADRSVVRRIKAHNGEVRHLVFIAGKNELASAGTDGAVRLWGITGTELLGTLLAPSEYAVTALTGTPDGQFLYAAAEDMTVKGWNVSLRALRGKLDLNNRQINSIALSPDGDFMAFAEEDESVLLWSIKESKVAWRNELDSSATKVIFSPDGKLLFTSGGDNWIREWDVSSGRLLKKIGGVSE